MAITKSRIKSNSKNSKKKNLNKNKIPKLNLSRFSKSQKLFGLIFILLFAAVGVYKLEFGNAAYSVYGTTSPYYCKAPRPVLSSGTKGDCVKYIQWSMKTYAGQNITVDGIFGSQTKQAVINIQNFFGYKGDGIVGPITWEIVDWMIRPGNTSTQKGVLRSACKFINTVNSSNVTTNLKSINYGSYLNMRVDMKNMSSVSWGSAYYKIEVKNLSGIHSQLLNSSIATSRIYQEQTFSKKISIKMGSPNSIFPKSWYLINVEVVDKYGDTVAFGPRCQYPIYVN